jgi:tape measure domain-containing protein
MLYFDVEADWQKFKRLRDELNSLEKQLNDLSVERSVVETERLEKRLQELRSTLEAMTKTAAVAGHDLEKGFERSIASQEQLLQDYNAQLIETRKNLNDLQRTMRTQTTVANNPNLPQGKRDKAAGVAAQTAGEIEQESAKLQELTSKRDKLNVSLQRSRTEYSLLQQEQQKLASTAQNVSSSITKFAAALGGAKLISDFGRKMVQTRAQFQSMEAALNTMVGSDKAGQLMTELKNLAKQSPLTMQSMVSAEKMMLSFGISANKTTKYIKAISDVSMGDSARFNALTLAFSQMSSAGRLMGQDLMQMVNAGFNPLEQMSRTTGKSIAQLKEQMQKGAISAEMVQQAFMDATQAGGKFAGMSEATAKTIGGQMSMLNDALDNMFNELGKSAEGFIVKGIGTVTGLVQSYQELVPVLTATVAALGSAKVASLVYIKVQEQSAVAARFYKVAISDVTAKQKLNIAMTKAATAAQQALNAAMKAAPWAIAAAAVGALVYAGIKWHNTQKEIHASEDRLGEAMAKTAQKTEEEQTKLNILAGELDNLKEGTDEYNKKKRELIDFAAQYDTALAKEMEGTNNLTAAYDKLALAIDEANKKKMAMSYYESEMSEMQSRNKKFVDDNYDKYKDKYLSGIDKTSDEYVRRTLAYGQLMDEIGKALEDNALELVERTRTFKSEITGEDISIKEKVYKGLSDAANQTLLEMVAGGSGGSFRAKLDKAIETNKITVQSVSKALEYTGQDYESLAKLQIDGVNKIVKEAADAADGVEKKWEKKTVEGLKDKAETSQSQMKQIVDILTDLKKKAAVAGASDQAESIQTMLNNLQNQANGGVAIVNGYVNQIKGQIDAINNEKLPAAMKRAKKAWQDAEKEYLRVKNDPNATKKDLTDKKTALDTAKKAYQDVGGKPIDYEQRVENERKANEDIAQMRRDHLDRMNNLEKDENKKNAAKIVADYDKTLADIEKKKAEAKKKFKEGTLTQSQYDEMNKLYKQEAEDARLKKEHDEKELTKSLIDGYTEYDKKRRDIEEKWARDKAALQAVIDNPETDEETRRRAQKAIDKGTIDSEVEILKNSDEYMAVFQNIDNYGLATLKNLQSKLEEVGGAAVKNLDPVQAKAYWEAYEQLQQRIAKLDPSGALAESLKRLKTAQDAQTKAVAKYNALLKSGKATPKEIAVAQKEMADAENETAKATNDVVRAQEAMGEQFQKMKEPINKFSGELRNMAGYADDTAQEFMNLAADIMDSTLSIIEQIKTVTEVSSDDMKRVVEVSGQAMEQSAQSTSAAIQAVEKASVILAIIGAVLQIGQRIEGMLDKRKQEAEEKTNEIAKMQQAVNRYKMSVLEAQQAETGWFNASGMENLEKQYEKGQQALKNYYESANRMEEKYTDKKGGGLMVKAGEFGTRLATVATDLAQEGLDAIGLDKVGDALDYVDLAKLSQKAYDAANGKEWKETDNNLVDTFKKSADEMVRARDNLRIQTQEAKKGFLGIGSKDEKTEDLETWLANNGFEGSLFGEDGMIDVQAADAVLEQFGDKLVGNTKETIEQLKESKQQYDEWLQSLKDYTSEMFGGLTDNMVDSLFNWLDTGEDVMDSFEKMSKDTFRAVGKDMVKQLSNKMIFDGFSKKIEDIYKQSQEDGWSSEQLAEEVGKAGAQLKQDVADAAPALQAATQAISDALGGIKNATDEDQQSAVAGAFKTMSEDTAGVLEGRFTAVYESNLAIQGILNNIGVNITQMVNNFISNRYVLNDIRSIVVDSNLQLKTIATNSTDIKKLCTTINEYSYETMRNTKKM